MVNPGFEEQNRGWSWFLPPNQTLERGYLANKLLGNGLTFDGNFAAHRHVYQIIPQTIVGGSYRFAMWAKTWYPDEQLAPGYQSPVQMRLCANGFGEANLRAAATTCGRWSTPMGQWQYLVVDVSAAAPQVAVMTQVEWLYPDNQPPRYEVVWDGGAFGFVPGEEVVLPQITATPGVLVRYPAQPFDPQIARESVTSLRALVEQIGISLDQIYGGQLSSCPGFEQLYNQAATVPFFTDIPADWTTIQAAYRFAAENIVTSGRDVLLLCQAGSGELSALNYGVARTGVEEAVQRLLPAVDLMAGIGE